MGSPAMVDKLFKEELFFELCLRGTVVSFSKTTVKKMKETLKSLLAEDQSDLEDKVTYDLESELELVDLK